DIDLDAAHAARLVILRRPALSAPAKPGGPTFDVSVARVRVDRIELDKAVANIAAVLDLDLSLRVSDERLTDLTLAAQRLDAPTDRARVTYAQHDDALLIDAVIDGATEGVISHMLGTEREPANVVVHAHGDGAG